MGMKKTEAGIIPEEWNVQSFSDTFRILNNNTFSRAELNYDSGQFRNIHYGDVLILYPEILDCTRPDVPFINEGTKISGSAQALQDGDIVMADTAEDETVGKVTEVINTTEKTVMSGLHTIPCRVKSGEFVSGWLGYYMNSHLYHDQLLPFIHGTKVSSVSKSSLGKTIIIIPAAKEQERIVAALADIDALIDGLQKLIKKKKAVRRGSLQFLLNDDHKYEWDECPITDLLKSGGIKIGPFGSQLKKEMLLTDGLFKVYGQENIYENDFSIGDRFLTSDHFQRLSSCEISPGDFMMSTMGTIGKCAIAPKIIQKGIMDSHLIRLRFDERKINPEYVLHLFSDQFDYLKRQTQQLSVGGIMDGLSVGIVSKLKVKYPKNKEDQVELINIFNDMEADIRNYEKELLKYQRVKQGMMEELLTGKVRLV